MAGMLPAPAVTGGKTKRKRGLPLKALTMAARAAGNPGLDEEQQQIIAAWLSLPKATQRAVVEDILAGGVGEMFMEDLPLDGAAAQEPVEEAPVVEEGAKVVADGGQWTPEEPGGW